MFEKELEEKFKAIFKVSKVTYDAPGESQEQGCLFVEIESCKGNISPPVQKAIVTGKAIMNAPSDKLPFGFFSKAIQQSDATLTKDLFFEDIEENTARFGNLVRRGFSFTYFFNGQFDPDLGTITSIDTTIQEI